MQQSRKGDGLGAAEGFSVIPVSPLTWGWGWLESVLEFPVAMEARIVEEVLAVRECCLIEVSRGRRFCLGKAAVGLSHRTAQDLGFHLLVC